MSSPNRRRINSINSTVYGNAREYQPRTDPPNIIVFGQTGAGKSSLINMLARNEIARVSSEPEGCTPSCHSYGISSPIANAKHRDASNTYTFWDTAGLNEGDQGNVLPREALDKLLNLVRDNSPNLIIYCIRGPRFSEMLRVNYDLFWGIVCGRNVPIVLVLTGLEHEPDMDKWWMTNGSTIGSMGMSFEGHACVTTIKGRDGMYETQYQQSERNIWRLVQEHAGESWNMSPKWFSEASRLVDQYMSLYNARTGRERGLLPPLITHNVILFGEAGSGKSSLINMVVGRDVAKVSNRAEGCTFKNSCYRASIGNTSFAFYDTAGLNEGDQGRVPHWEAINGLYTLIRQLDGVSLLVYCTRWRLRDISRANWVLFNEIICGKQVPIIAIVTGLEDEAVMDDWWNEENQNTFTRYQMIPRAVGCVTAIRGTNDAYAAKYDESQSKLRGLIKKYHRRQPWSEDKDQWFVDIYQKVHTTRFCNLPSSKLEFVQAMRQVFDEFVRETNMSADEKEKLEATLLNAEKKVRKVQLFGRK